ncbi:MAG: ankyrin repeat domain-containing protein [Micavibrio sp.]|nr:ankyrin repeat domain-containing protein [Micavibrio sp.]
MSLLVKKIADTFAKVRRRPLDALELKRDRTIFEAGASFGNCDEMLRIADKYTDAIHWRDSKQGTLLHYAAQHRRADLVETYIARGAEIEAVDNGGYTPLHYAAQCAGDTPTAGVDALLKHNANMEARNAKGETPLMFAVQRNKPWNAQALILAGADPAAADSEGQNPLGLAAQYPGGELHAVLQKALTDRAKSLQEAARQKWRDNREQEINGITDGVTTGTKRALRAMKPVSFRKNA